MITRAQRDEMVRLIEGGVRVGLEWHQFIGVCYAYWVVVNKLELIHQIPLRLSKPFPPVRYSDTWSHIKKYCWPLNEEGKRARIEFLKSLTVEE